MAEAGEEGFGFKTATCPQCGWKWDIGSFAMPSLVYRQAIKTIQSEMKVNRQRAESMKESMFRKMRSEVDRISEEFKKESDRVLGNLQKDHDERIARWREPILAITKVAHEHLEKGFIELEKAHAEAMAFLEDAYREWLTKSRKSMKEALEQERNFNG